MATRLSTRAAGELRNVSLTREPPTMLARTRRPTTRMVQTKRELAARRGGDTASGSLRSGGQNEERVVSGLSSPMDFDFNAFQPADPGSLAGAPGTAAPSRPELDGADPGSRTGDLTPGNSPGGSALRQPGHPVCLWPVLGARRLCAPPSRADCPCRRTALYSVS